MERKNAASVDCKNIFKDESLEKRKKDFTTKIAELINGQERAKQVHTK